MSGASASATAVPLRVVAERLSAEEARAAEAADAERRAREHRPGPVLSVVGQAVSSVAAAAPVPSVSPVSAAPGTVAPHAGAVAPVAAPGLPVPVTVPPRRSVLAELLALVTGRRRTGRHRPDTVLRQGWSMFAPERQRRRRRWFGIRV